MKALTLWPEWLPCFTHLDKLLENRGWSPPEGLVGERIALHAGRAIGGSMGGGNGGSVRAHEWLAPVALEAGWDVDLLTRPGHFRWRRAGDPATPWQEVRIPLGAIVCTVRLTASTTSSTRKWAMRGQVHWEVDDVRILRRPILCGGKQGLWDVPAEHAADLEDTLPVDAPAAPAPPPTPGRRPRRWLDVSVPCPGCHAEVRILSACAQDPDAEIDSPPIVEHGDAWRCENGHGGGVHVGADAAQLVLLRDANDPPLTAEDVEAWADLGDEQPLAEELRGRRAPLASPSRTPRRARS